MTGTFNFEWETALMQFLQSHMNDTMIEIASVISSFGEDLCVVLLLGYLYWCHDKDKAIKVGMNMMIASIICPMAKNILKRNRPYMTVNQIECFKPIDNDADIYDITAQGYSFPSGHSINSSSSFGSLAYYFSHRILKILGVIMPVLVGLSRICLGVHYPTDVLAGWIIGYGCVIVIPLLAKQFSNMNHLYYFLLLFALSGIFFCRTNDYFSMLGVLIGFIIAESFERKYVCFDKPANRKEVFIRLAAGGLLFLILNSFLRTSFSIIAGNRSVFMNSILITIRYIIILFVETGLYPMVFSKRKTD